MKLRDFKRVIYFLEEVEEYYEVKDTKNLSPELIKHYTDSELREMIYWLYRDVWSKNSLGFKNRPELIELINSDQSVLLWTIHQLEASMTATSSYSQVNVSAFFERTNNEIHYLASKPVEQWDAYDASNYTSLLWKTGTTKKVYAIFDSDVLKEDVYTITTKPSYFFDTRKEAETEINSIVDEGKFTKEELVIHSLWLLT